MLCIIELIAMMYARCRCASASVEVFEVQFGLRDHTAAAPCCWGPAPGKHPALHQTPVRRVFG